MRISRHSVVNSVIHDYVSYMCINSNRIAIILLRIILECIEVVIFIVYIIYSSKMSKFRVKCIYNLTNEYSII